MTIPLAAIPTSPTPGLWLTVDLSARRVSPGSQSLRGLILGPENATGGNITVDKEVRKILSLDDVEAAAGVGGLPALAYQGIISRCPDAQIDLVCPTKPGGQTATNTITASGTITESGVVSVIISGRQVDIPWNVGETPSDFHAKAVQYIGRLAQHVFTTPSIQTEPNAVLLTANAAGPVGNDVTVRVKVSGCTGGTVAVKSYRCAGGTTEPDYTAALAAIAGRQYDFIALLLSNADAASTTGSLSKLLTHLVGHATGPHALLQQGIVAVTGLRTAFSASAQALNAQPIELLCYQNAESMPAEFAGEELGDRMHLRSLYYSANRIGNASDLIGSLTPVDDNPSTIQSDAALRSGVSVGAYTDDGDSYLMRAVTTYTRTATGAQLLVTDCNEIDAMYEYANDLRAFLATEYANVKVTQDLSEEDEELPENVVEERDIRASIIARTKDFWIPKGVINGTHFQTQVDTGKLIVKVDSVDETQVDIFIPAKPFKNLSKLGVYVAKDG